MSNIYRQVLKSLKHDYIKKGRLIMVNAKAKEIKEKLENDLPKEVVIENETYYLKVGKSVTNTDIFVDYRRNEFDDLFLMSMIDVKGKRVKIYLQKLVKIDTDKYFRIVEKYKTITEEIYGVLRRSGLIL